ncbi:regulatory LuxR family protein [Lentzea atacamensis]|uniref:Regulatory LuxR family protein n=1 Tax=Lentzea atacamensis TaxID=531938 RepID=A0ABX9EIN8_9PSEU|nr:helix-turn-helix transcriptional regulator [Lentzea atacamensis]RAS70414.1 regulatory LuxR family protein [Lentzea atacamensis]
MATHVVHTHHARASQARKLVEPLLSGELPALAAPTIVDGWLLEAVLVDRSGDQRRAHEALTEALAAAEPYGALRPCFNAGKPVRDLLARGAGRFGRLESFATTTMTALPAASTAPVDVLTIRERDLLLELPSMRTTEEIADSLFVSVNKVKTHLRGTYRKLGVNQRRDAVLAARRPGLIQGLLQPRFGPLVLLGASATLDPREPADTIARLVSLATGEPIPRQRHPRPCVAPGCARPGGVPPLAHRLLRGERPHRSLGNTRHAVAVVRSGRCGSCPPGLTQNAFAEDRSAGTASCPRREVTAAPTTTRVFLAEQQLSTVSDHTRHPETHGMPLPLKGMVGRAPLSPTADRKLAPGRRTPPRRRSEGLPQARPQAAVPPAAA